MGMEFPLERRKITVKKIAQSPGNSRTGEGKGSLKVEKVKFAMRKSRFMRENYTRKRSSPKFMLGKQASHKIRGGKWANMSLWDNGRFPCGTAHPIEGLKAIKFTVMRLKHVGIRPRGSIP